MSGCDRLGALSLLLVATATAAAGQDIEPQPVLNAQFSFSNPGARSLGFGGAFVALADDATAAFANPAGLTQLAEPEVSLEGRSWSTSTPFTARGSLGGPASGIGLDAVAGLVAERSEDDVLGVSFLSFVYPRKKWSFALFRHLWANFESTFETQGLFLGTGPCCRRRFLDQRSTADLEIVSYGLAAAYSVSEDLSLGISLVSFDGSLVLDTAAYRPDDDASAEGRFGPTSFLPERLAVRSTMTIDGQDFGLSGGFLWHLSRRWRLGGVFRQGPEFELRGEYVVGPAGFLGLPPGPVRFDCCGEVALPDVYGLGTAFRSDGGRWTVAFEWDRVQYSTSIDSLELDDQTLDDGDELRLGGEYAFLDQPVLVALRLGVWLDPDHQTRALEDLEPTDQNRFTQAILRPGDDELHLAAGVGVTFERIQIDFAVDLSDLVDTVSLSTLYRF